MLTDRLTTIFNLFEQMVSMDRFGHRFPNQRASSTARLPLEYQSFVSAPERYLPSNWQLYSFFGHETTTLETVTQELSGGVDPEQWLIFGKTGDEDFLVFDMRPAAQGAVIWCDADDVDHLDTRPHYAKSFAEMLAKVTASIAESHIADAQTILRGVAKYAR